MVPILVVLTILLFVLADVILQRVRARRVAAVEPVRAGVADLVLPELTPERFALPGGLFFHRGHTWANLLFSGQVKVGVDDFVQRLFGRVDGITLPPLGVTVRAGQPFAALHQGRRRATVLAPIDGTICAVNGEVARTPWLVRRDPYTRGWLVAIRPTDVTAGLAGLVAGERALAWLREELRRVQQLLLEVMVRHHDPVVGPTAADGGLGVEGLLERLDDEGWEAFQARFLNG